MSHRRDVIAKMAEAMSWTLSIDAEEAATDALNALLESDLVSLVREAVESGAIEGEVVEVHQDTFGRSILVMAGNPMADAADNLKSDQRYLVIPDGGSET